MGFLSNLLNGAKAEGSAFAKIALADVKALEAKGRIVAIDAAHEAKRVVIEEFQAEAVRVHAEADAIAAEFEKLLARL